MNRIILTLTLLAVLTIGCASGPSLGDLAHYPGQLIQQARHMVYVRLDTPCADGGRRGQMLAIVRAEDAGNVGVVCTPDCKDCRVVKVRKPVPKPGSEICQ